MNDCARHCSILIGQPGLRRSLLAGGKGGSLLSFNGTASPQERKVRSLEDGGAGQTKATTGYPLIFRNYCRNSVSRSLFRKQTCLSDWLPSPLSPPPPAPTVPSCIHLAGPFGPGTRALLSLSVAFRSPSCSAKGLRLVQMSGGPGFMCLTRLPFWAGGSEGGRRLQPGHGVINAPSGMQR